MNATLVLPIDFALAAFVAGAVAVLVTVIGVRGHYQELERGEPPGWFILAGIGFFSLIILAMYWQGMPVILRVFLQTTALVLIGVAVTVQLMKAIGKKLARRK